MNKERAREIFELLATKGAETYYCGGYVRDMVLGVEAKDMDLEVFGIDIEKAYEELKKLGRVKRVGQHYGIILFEDIEISVPNLTLDQIELAINRRDLTINSLYMNVKNKEIIDLRDGQKDIKDKIIRVNSEKTLIEDPIRILRIAQFKGRLEFEVDKDTEEYCKKHKNKILDMPRERLFIEIEKILMKCRKPSIAFEWLKKVGILEILLPEIHLLSNIEQGKRYHPEGDVFVHTMLALDVLEIEERELDVMFGILLHDIGKAMVEAVDKGNEHISFLGHESAGADKVEEVMSRFTNNVELIKSVKDLVELHMYPNVFEKHIKTKTIKKLANKIDIYKIMKVHKADTLGRKVEVDISYIDKVIEIYEEIKNKMEPIIKGRDLIKIGMKPSEEFGRILNELYEMQLNEVFDDYESGIKVLRGLIGSK